MYINTCTPTVNKDKILKLIAFNFRRKNILVKLQIYVRSLNKDIIAFLNLATTCGPDSKHKCPALVTDPIDVMKP